MTGPRTWPAALGGAVAMFLVQPPADLWPLAWLAPLPWLGLVLRPAGPDRRGWAGVWSGGFLYWLLAIHWLRLPHPPATAVGWVLLSAYLACYLPLFIWSARRLVNRWRWPLVPAAVVAWMATDFMRGELFGGFSFAGLGHTQWRWLTLIQAADAVSAVGVGGIVMAGAAGLAATLAAWREGGLTRPWLVREALPAVGVVTLTLAYGSWRLATAPLPAGEPLDVLLVQGSIDTELKHDPDAAGAVLAHYDALTVAGLAERAELPDLVVWPETMWRWGLIEIDPAEVLPAAVLDELVGPASAGEPAAERQARGRAAAAAQRLDALAVYARRYGTTWIVGLDRQRITPTVPAGYESFNAALCLAADGRPLACYDKMHPVMFGEYVPLANRFPFLYRLTPLPGGLTAGTQPVLVEVAGRGVAPTICYETALPGAIRSLVRGLAAADQRPDLIVNLTNDGWFWGSSELDMHLVAAIFRAIEVRTPILVAANTGFSAAIDASGRLLARGPRRDTATLRVAVAPDGRQSPWLAAGSLPLGLTLAVVGMAGLEWLVATRLAPGGGLSRQ
jgi:apolipoprotein N-acyltransferase